MAVLFTADTHFGDARTLRFHARPFADVAEMDREMIRRWNDAVGPEDEVWHLGDFASGRGLDRAGAVLAALHGRKHLITGNNDPDAVAALPDWAGVAPYAEIEREDTRLVLCHYALRTWNGVGRGALDLHGHSHGRLAPLPRQRDVGVDVWQFAPVRLDRLRRRRARAADPAGAGR